MFLLPIPPAPLSTRVREMACIISHAGPVKAGVRHLRVRAKGGLRGHGPARGGGRDREREGEIERQEEEEGDKTGGQRLLRAAWKSFAPLSPLAPPLIARHTGTWHALLSRARIVLGGTPNAEPLLFVCLYAGRWLGWLGMVIIFFPHVHSIRAAGGGISFPGGR